MTGILTSEPFESRTVNGYTLLDILGSGGTAIAYKAEKDQKQFCIREHRFGKIKGMDSFKHLDLFQREYSVLQQLDHPQIPKVHDFFEVQEGRDISVYMVQDLVPGKCLETLLKEQGVFEEQKVIDILQQLSNILEYTHSRVPPVVHRDIKPSNIMMDDQGKIYLIDFGIVQQEILKTIGGSTSFGTLGYSAPEVFAGMSTPKSDLYSVGATTLTLVSGIPIDKMMNGFEICYDTKVQFTNPNLQTLVDSLISVNPAERIETAKQLGTYIQQIKEGKSLQFKDHSTSWFTNWLASMVPTRVVQRLAQTQQGVIDNARQKRLLVTMDEPDEIVSKPVVQNRTVKCQYGLMTQTSTYASGVENLRHNGISRPFTFKENIQARVESYGSDDYASKCHVDSCTGIVYKAGTTKFKIIPHCTQLCDIPKDFSQSFMPVEYEKIEGIELDRDSSLFGKKVKYSELLTKAEIMEHPAWLAAVEEDKKLLETYINIVFSHYTKIHDGTATDKLMGFYVRPKPATDELRYLFLDYLIGSGASGCHDLINKHSYFLRR